MTSTELASPSIKVKKRGSQKNEPAQVQINLKWIPFVSSPRTQLVVDRLGITREMLDEASSQELPSRALHSGDPDVAEAWNQLMAAKRRHFKELVLAEREHVTPDELAEYRRLRDYQYEMAGRKHRNSSASLDALFLASAGGLSRPDHPDDDDDDEEEEDPTVARQREQVERTREELKAEILSMVTSELAKKQLAAAREAQEKKFALKLKALEEDREKLKEVRKGVMEQKKKKREDLMQKKLEEKERLREEVQTKIESKLAVVAERKQAMAEIKKAEAEAFAEKLEEVKEKMRVERERLAAEAAERQAKSAEKQRQIQENKANLMHELADAAAVRSIEFSKRLVAAQRIEAEAEAKRQASGEAAKDRHEEAIKKNEKLREEAWEAIKERNRKHEEDIAKVKERAAKVRIEQHQKVKESYERKTTRKDAAGEKAAREAEMARHIKLKREMYEDLVKINAARIAKQHEHTNQKRMLRIAETEAKLRDKAQEKEALYQKRIVSIREGWAEKSKLKAELDKLKYCNNTRQFTKSVNKLGIELPAVEDPGKGNTSETSNRGPEA
ncbi:hypothetical protein FOL47_006443 [Perkinsus chesapeaki]|uniref:Uncharacterized protein n=1 Tax=Perkinsus chesapeaki TaxID=330153 RepID=A0A7J6MY79_PERCH|nr:hypothetical protein FOL47_006443 [Perkinsus chesapeaki]